MLLEHNFPLGSASLCIANPALYLYRLQCFRHRYRMRGEGTVPRDPPGGFCYWPRDQEQHEKPPSLC